MQEKDNHNQWLEQKAEELKKQAMEAAQKDANRYQQDLKAAMEEADAKRKEAIAQADAEAEKKRQAALADIERRRREAEEARRKSLDAAQKIREENERILRQGKELTEEAVEYGTKYSRYYKRRGMQILRDGYKLMWDEVKDSFRGARHRDDEPDEPAHLEEKKTKRITEQNPGRRAIAQTDDEYSPRPAVDSKESPQAASVNHTPTQDNRTVEESVQPEPVQEESGQEKSAAEKSKHERLIEREFALEESAEEASPAKESVENNSAEGQVTSQKAEQERPAEVQESPEKAEQERPVEEKVSTEKTEENEPAEEKSAETNTKAKEPGVRTKKSGKKKATQKKAAQKEPHGRQVTHSGADNTIPIANYFAIVAIVPAILSVLAYELVGFIMTYQFHVGDFHPLEGLGMIVPMSFLTEFFMYFLAKSLSRRINVIQGAMREVAEGNYDVRLDSEALQPFTEIADSFNTMAEELGSVETLRDDFINDFSHEFKTPITSINGFAKLLLEEDVDEEDRQEYLQIIASESGRLAELATNTLMMNKLDNYSAIPHQEDYSLDEQIRRNVALLSPQWDKKHIHMEVDLERVTYHGNPDLMSQVWINIMNNSIKFTPENGTIAVRLKVRDNNAYISIADTGKGMSEEDVKRIFQKYYQADPSHASKGMGLGLSIAHRIVELCGGDIHVDSTLDVGSTFTVRLPLEKAG